MTSVDSIYPKARTSGLIFRHVGDQLMIYEFKRAKVFSLNRPAALVWKLCDGRRTVEDIAKAMALELEGDVNEQAVWLALKRFQGDRLLAKTLLLPEHAKSSTRRQMLKWAAAGIPVVLSIVLPTAAIAQSGDPGRDSGDGHGDEGNHGGDPGGDRGGGQDGSHGGQDPGHGGGEGGGHGSGPDGGHGGGPHGG